MCCSRSGHVEQREQQAALEKFHFRQYHLLAVGEHQVAVRQERLILI